MDKGIQIELIEVHEKLREATGELQRTKSLLIGTKTLSNHYRDLWQNRKEHSERALFRVYIIGLVMGSAISTGIIMLFHN